MSGPLFGIVPTGQPLIAEAASTPSPTSFLYALPSTKPFSHIMVLLLPNISLPPNTAAAIYLASASDVAAGNSNFKFLGAIGPGKESAMFNVKAVSSANELVVGIEIESEESVARQMQEVEASKSSGATGKPSTTVLAQRIIQNAFNFLSSYSGTVGADGVEVVPLKAFENWWKKFESRVRADPSFLEKQAD